MSHPAQRKFCKMVRRLFPDHFRNVSVVDVGSLHINGNNRGLFRQSTVNGIDVIKGRNVDLVGKAHEVIPNLTPIKVINWYGLNPFYPKRKMIVQKSFDTIISTEALEHDSTWVDTLDAIYKAVRPGGLILITCAGDGRAEHGTSKVRPQDSPGTNDYYKNVSNEMFAGIYQPSMFKDYYLRQFNTDLQFYGIKK